VDQKEKYQNSSEVPGVKNRVDDSRKIVLIPESKKTPKSTSSVNSSPKIWFK